MLDRRRTTHEPTSDEDPGAYVLIVRGPDGRPRFERFAEVGAYRARLIGLQQAPEGSLSIEEVVGLLDA